MLYPTVNNFPTINTMPYYYQPTQTVISASTLTPSTALAVPLVPTISSVMSNLPNYPLFPNVFTYQDVNADSNLRRQVTDMFFEKILKNWMKYHYLDLYAMVTVSGGSAQLVKDINQVKTNIKSDPAENAIKYEFLIDNFLTKNDVYNLLGKFRKMNNLNWWDLKEHSDKVRSFIHHKVRKYMVKQIVEGKK
jgi:hypothetical protein